MSEVDERRIAEIAKGAPRVLRQASSQAAQGEVRKVVEVMALLGGREWGGGGAEGEP